MAQVVMTDAQKDLLLADPNFTVQVKYAIMDQALFTRGLDGTSVSGAANLKSWANNRPLSAQIIANPDMINGGAPKFFINEIARQAIPCWNNSTNLTSDAIAYLISNNFFGANSLAQAWFTEQTYKNPW